MGAGSWYERHDEHEDDLWADDPRFTDDELAAQEHLYGQRSGLVDRVPTPAHGSARGVGAPGRVT